jgi:hypothetical protein
MFVNWFVDDAIFDDISNVKCSFNFSILEKSRSRCNSAENLLEVMNFADDVNKSEKKNKRNWWNNKSNDKVKNEKNK